MTAAGMGKWGHAAFPQWVKASTDILCREPASLFQLPRKSPKPFLNFAAHSAKPVGVKLPLGPLVPLETPLERGRIMIGKAEASQVTG